jgi:creatinine amidohydrolase/Fe(II)-dependent formamide hydrolase-like protein
MANRRFDELTDPEIAAALARSPRVILPMGSIEQHGPHLPTGTDFFAANSIALAVAERTDALVLPLCPLGVTPLHMPYQGTVSLRPQTLQDVVWDIGSSLASHGCREFVILNWHEGNIPSLALVAEQLHRSLGLAVVTVHACYVAEDMFGALTKVQPTKRRSASTPAHIGPGEEIGIPVHRSVRRDVRFGAVQQPHSPLLAVIKRPELLLFFPRP